MVTFRRRVRKKEKLAAAAVVSCQSRLPEQKTDPPKRDIPPEIMEQILMNLPIKSLLRFSCASTSWNSIITSPQLKAKKGRKMVILNDNPYFDFRDAFCSPLSAISDGNATPSMLVCPFRAVVKLKAFCNELCCVQVKKFLYLWNPSTGARTKLPGSAPLHFDNRELCPQAATYKVAYGLGYDAVEDDYKLLKVLRYDDYVRKKKSLIYSLKSNSWREIPSFPDDFSNSNGLFVNGSLNWMVQGDYFLRLVSFEFSTENFRVLKQPMYVPEPNLRWDVVDVAVLRSKLCVFVNYYYWGTAFVLWAMEDDGVVESWTKLYEIRYKDIPPIVSEFRRRTLRPVYLYEDGRVVIWFSCCDSTEWDIIVYKDDMQVVAHSKIPRSNAIAPSGTKTVPTKAGSRRVCGGFVYVESLALGIN